jgi:hypothetical protein
MCKILYLSWHKFDKLSTLTMNPLKNILLLLITISALTLLTSCGAAVTSMANKHLTEERGAIPPDFGKDNSTIVFITYKRSYNKYLKKNVKKIYKGKYEFATKEDFESLEKYNDIDRYRYVFDFSYRSPGVPAP